MNVLSLFDGMSCGRIALERAGIVVDSYYASEIDKYAISVTQKNYPDTFQLECERLQTVPNGYTASVSSTQCYKMLGNGWTVDVIAHIFKCMIQNIKQDIPEVSMLASPQGS